tara:strand:- start:4313 stop:4747 length:435 start_codon:yes stop_codon:yes gene_type:complete
MAKWSKSTFIACIKENCNPRINTIVMDLVKFTEDKADQISWGRGEGYGTMTFKCKSDDYGIVPLFHITTNGQIKFQLNYLRNKISKREILRDYQLKLESNFMLDFGEEIYPSDIYHELDDLFTIKTEVDKFLNTIEGISARLRQ